MNKSKGWHRYGVSTKERLDNLIQALLHHQDIFVAHDKEYLVMNYGDGRALPIWVSIDEAKTALPTTEWPEFRFQAFKLEEFKSRYKTLSKDHVTHIAIRPDKFGNCKIITVEDFFQQCKLN